MIYDFVVGGNSYQLKLTTRDLMSIETRLGMNPLMIFGAKGDRVPQITEMLQIVATSFRLYNHSISENDAYDIIDKWFDEGNTVKDLISLVLEIYKVSGLYKDEKN